MSNWGFEILEEQLQLLKLHNSLHIHVKNENDPWCLLPQFSQLLLGQISKVRSVLKSLEPADFKTDLTFWIWWRFEVVIANKTKKRNSENHSLHKKLHKNFFFVCENKYFFALNLNFHIGYSEIGMLDGGITGLISFASLQ